MVKTLIGEMPPNDIREAVCVVYVNGTIADREETVVIVANTSYGVVNYHRKYTDNGEITVRRISKYLAEEMLRLAKTITIDGKPFKYKPIQPTI